MCLAEELDLDPQSEECRAQVAGGLAFQGAFRRRQQIQAAREILAGATDDQGQIFRRKIVAGQDIDRLDEVVYLCFLLFKMLARETFAWIGGFSSAPNTKRPAELVPDPAAAKNQLKLLWLSCGNREGLIGISQGMHAYLKEHGVPHVWNVDSNGHDPRHWRNNLCHFVQQIFR